MLFIHMYVCVYMWVSACMCDWEKASDPLELVVSCGHRFLEEQTVFWLWDHPSSPTNSFLKFPFSYLALADSLFSDCTTLPG